MNEKFIKISAWLGLFIILITGCDSLIKKPANEEGQQIFESVGKMLGNEEDNFMSLAGKWKFSIGDDTVWALAEYNDSDWEEIKVPSSWENEGFHGYNGYAWYRKTFTLPKKFSGKDLFLDLGFIDDIDQTFVNGQLVGLSGGFPPYFLTAYTAFRKYYIPKKILKEGKNIIAVRVYDAQLEGGIVKGRIGVFPAKQKVLSLSELELDLSLSGIWKFNLGDNILWSESDFDDKDWSPVFVPAFWETQGYRNYNGFAWYRKEFNLPNKLTDEKMVLLLGKIDDIDQTYLNGIMIGSVGDWKFDDVPLHFNENSEWETLRAYYIPDNLLKERKNIIAVRIYDGYIDGGIYEGPIGLITQQKYREYWSRKKKNAQLEK